MPTLHFASTLYVYLAKFSDIGMWSTLASLFEQLVRQKANSMPFMTKTLTAHFVGVLALGCLTAVGQQPSNLGSDMLPQGLLEPWRKSEVACVETGLIQAIYIKKGQRVSVGDRLAELRNDTTRIQLELAEAQAAADGRIATVRADLALNERKVAAFKAARANSSSSQMELERAVADLEIARGRLQTELDEHKVLELRAAQIRQALRDRTVLAPIDGIVTEVYKDLGELVAPNTPDIVRIVDVSKLRANFYLTEEDIRSLPANRIVEIELANGARIQAEIENIAPVADKESGLITTSVVIENANQDILSSRCSLLIKPNANASTSKK
jgi:RND family efflux transporter MFP subunit